MNNSETHAGYVAIVGRPNIGKSTLLNRILDKKVSITSRKPQTTRNKILGIKTVGNFQAIYVDTPGLRNKGENKLNSYMNKATLGALFEVDIIIFTVAGTIWAEEDEAVLQALQKVECPIILVMNKVDLVTQKSELLRCIENINKKRKFEATIPLSAIDGTNVNLLEEMVRKLLPINLFFFDQQQITDRNNSFLVSEIIREKLMRFLGQELPYSVSVTTDKLEFNMNKDIVYIMATIYVERNGQKAIIIGKKGETLKNIGTSARRDIENLFGQKVFLQLWIKVRRGWTNNEALLQQFGYCLDI